MTEPTTISLSSGAACSDCGYEIEGNLVIVDLETGQTLCLDCGIEPESACCAIARETGESHYHCANCGKESSMFGHALPLEGWYCKPLTDRDPGDETCRS